MATILTFIICVVLSIIVAAILNRTYCFNSNVDSPKGISIPEFEVIEISKHYSTDFKTIAKYTVVNSYFKRKKQEDGFIESINSMTNLVSIKLATN